MRRFALSAVVAACTVSYATHIAASTGGGHAPRWRSYREPSSGALIDFPRDLFVVDAGLPLVGTGRQYSTSDGRAFMAVFTLPIPDDADPIEYLERNSELNKEPVSYRRVTAHFFAVSGIDGNSIYYNRCNFTGRSMKCVHLEYPAEERRAWDKIVTRISLSLRG
jgi:hypothetical protein